ncbi:MAG: hypothetical protein ACRC8S_00940 [Fimbriiglobus sp.]
MAEDILKQFTPTPPNRDAILFAAGRASVKSLWRWVALALVVTNLVTLALWQWPRSTAPHPTETPYIETREVVVEPSAYLALRDTNWDQPRLPAPSNDAPANPIWHVNSRVNLDRLITP